MLSESLPNELKNLDSDIKSAIHPDEFLKAAEKATAAFIVILNDFDRHFINKMAPLIQVNDHNSYKAATASAFRSTDVLRKAGYNRNDDPSRQGDSHSLNFLLHIIIEMHLRYIVHTILNNNPQYLLSLHCLSNDNVYLHAAITLKILLDMAYFRSKTRHSKNGHVSAYKKFPIFLYSKQQEEADKCFYNERRYALYSNQANNACFEIPHKYTLIQELYITAQKKFNEKSSTLLTDVNFFVHSPLLNILLSTIINRPKILSAILKTKVAF